MEVGALVAEAAREQQTPVAYLAALEAEVTERRERRRLLDARFPIIERLQDFRFDEDRSGPRSTIAAPAEGFWVDDRESVIFVGEAGSTQPSSLQSRERGRESVRRRVRAMCAV